MKFELHTIESAPEAVKAELETAEKAYGNIPNLYRGFATAPATLKVYLAFNELLKEHGNLSPVEQQVVYLTVSAENECTYCVGAHSVLADMVKMPEQTLAELREQRPLSDPKLDTLRRFTLSVMAHRGWVSEQDIADFQAAGYDQRHLLEVLTLLAQKTLSNYYNHVAQTPLDEMFQPRAWEPGEAMRQT
ncbi:MAG: carboxymuconolactone decarboxylase family protein [Thiogranum sp.]